MTWPAITAKNISKYLPKSAATIKGHQDQVRQNIRSTKPTAPGTSDNEHLPTEKTHEVYTAVIDTNDAETRNTYSDLTGRFPHVSSAGNQYVLVMYHYDSNAILVEPLKTRTGPTIYHAHKKMFD